MTILTPSMVMAVSAILEAKMNLWCPVGSKTLFCSLRESFPWRGKTENTLGLSLPSNILTNSEIYSIPEQKHKRCPLNLIFILLLSSRISSFITFSIRLTILLSFFPLFAPLLYL